ncbi:hypothetical protein HAX54_004064 [Datura stramonium]|uniref:Uncharacterized protein n=1 Tax=Datura stramonium TaxID=4076 RepID=A0ABS8T755_DATST|nr:hypothetical protein [Datura stramonium]
MWIHHKEEGFRFCYQNHTLPQPYPASFGTMDSSSKMKELQHKHMVSGHIDILLPYPLIQYIQMHLYTIPLRLYTTTSVVSFEYRMIEA